MYVATQRRGHSWETVSYIESRGLGDEKKNDPGKSWVHGACCGRYMAGDGRLHITADKDGVEITKTE